MNRQEKIKPPTPTPEQGEKGIAFAIEQGWRAAITLSNNICVQESDDYNSDDKIEEAAACGACARRIRANLDSCFDYIEKPAAPQPHSPALQGENPKKICYCGSLRVAKEAFQKAEYESVLKGDIALLPCCMFVDIQREYGAESDYKQKADDLHKRKIDICDEVFVLNVGGYIGESTRSEIEYATKIGKPIKYLEP